MTTSSPAFWLHGIPSVASIGLCIVVSASPAASQTTTTTLPPVCGDSSGPICGGTCPAGQTCEALCLGPAFPAIVDGCPDGIGCGCVEPPACGSGSPPTCGGTCPVGFACVDALTQCACTQVDPPDFDLNGHWQATTIFHFGGDDIFGVNLFEIAQGASGTLTATREPLCGSLAIGTVMDRMSSCAPSVLYGAISGSSVRIPVAGCAPLLLTFEHDPSFPGGCTEVHTLETVAGWKLTQQNDADSFSGHSGIHADECPGTPIIETDPMGEVCSTTTADILVDDSIVEFHRNDVPVGGDPVTRYPFPGSSVTFEGTVLSPGIVGVLAVTIPDGSPDGGFQVVGTGGGLILYYDVITTATFSGTILTCITYPDADQDGLVDGSAVNELGLRLLHDEGGTLVDSTADLGATPNPDPVANVICGRTDSLSQFTFGAATNLCGNGFLDGGESCDDGNLVPGDGCDATCASELPGTVVGVGATKLVVIDKLAAADKAKMVFVSKGSNVTKGSGTDIDGIDATFSVAYVDGSTAGAFLLPTGMTDGTSGWTVNKPTVAKYVNKTAPDGPTHAKVAVIKPGKLLKLVGKGLGDVPFDVYGGGDPGAGGVRTAYCVANGSEEWCHCSVFPVCSYKLIAAGTGAKLLCKGGSPDMECAAISAP